MDGETAYQRHPDHAPVLGYRGSLAFARSRPASTELGRATRKRRFAFLIVGDALGFGVACLAAHTLSALLWPVPSHHAALAVPLVLFAVMAFNLAARGHYAREVTIWDEVGDVILACTFGLLLNYAIDYAAGNGVTVLEPAVRWALTVPLLIGGRGLVRTVLRAANIWSVRTLVVADAPVAPFLTAVLQQEANLGLKIVAELAPHTLLERDRDSALALLADGYGAEFVVMSDTVQTEQANALAGLLDRASVPFAISSVQEEVGFMHSRARHYTSHNASVLSNYPPLPGRLDRAMKRAVDVACSSLLLLALAPVMLLLAAAVRLDGGPSIFKHERIGLGGRRFGCMKFRTMHINSAALLAEILATDPAAAQEWAAIRKLKQDPRITPIGKFLRLTSLDELPQLFNVLRGEMSLVGPRPIVDAEAEAYYGDNMFYYQQTRPGITGLWQVTGRNNTSYARRVQLDVWYVKNRTFMHDLAILVMTVWAVLLRKGAN